MHKLPSWDYLGCIKRFWQILFLFSSRNFKICLLFYSIHLLFKNILLVASLVETESHYVVLVSLEFELVFLPLLPGY